MIKTSTFILCISLMFTANTWAMDIRSSHSGSWYNADHSGHGFSIQVLDEEQLVVYWFAYTPDGEPTFLVSLADIAGDTAYGTLHQYSGMRFGDFDPGTLNEEVWGTFSLAFSGCNTAVVTYQSTATHNGTPYGSGSIDVTRLTGIDGLDCFEPQSLAKYGNYVAKVMDEGVDVGEAEIMILGNGTLAYFSRIEGVYYERGFGHLTMTGEADFEFELAVDYGGPYWGPSPEKHTYQASGRFSDGGVTLEAPGGLLLEGVVDPAAYETVTLGQVAATYVGWTPGGMMSRFALHIAGDGSVTGTAFFCSLTGEVTIPDPEINQFYIQAEVCGFEPSRENHAVSGIGTFRENEIYLVVEWAIRDIDFWHTWDFTLEKQ